MARGDEVGRLVKPVWMGMNTKEGRGSELSVLLCFLDIQFPLNGIGERFAVEKGERVKLTKDIYQRLENGVRRKFWY